MKIVPVKPASLSQPIKAGLLALTLLAAGPFAQAEETRLDIAQARQLAAQSLVSGRADLAETLSRGLLLKDPNDVSALVMLSRAQRLQGQNSQAAQTAKRAWAASTTQREQFFSAQATAQALSAAGHRGRAQLWLRRAAEVAPDEAHKSRAIADFRHVRQRKARQTTFSFGISPSNNINNRPSIETYDFLGIPVTLTGASRALSGTVIQTGSQTTWRHDLSQRTQLRFGGALDVTRIRLSSDARAQAPTARNSDYNSTAANLSFGLTYRQNSGPMTVDLTYGKRWYGGSVLADTQRLALSKTLRAGPRSILRFSGYAETQTRLDGNTSGSSDVLNAGLLWSRALDGGARLTVQGALSDVDSASPQVDHAARSLGVTYQLGKPVLGAQLSLSARLDQRDYRKFGGTRTDTQLDLGLSAVLAEHEVYGFAPTVDLSTRRNSSTLAPYTTRELSVGLGLVSAF